jgi:SpoVK/Ycf46/Vps4 family AAA+-type ATPase
LQSIARNLHLGPHVSLESLAAQTEHFTGADLGGLIGTAHLAAVHSSLDAHTNGDQEGASSSSDGGATQDELVGEVLVIGRRSKGSQGKSRAELAELRKRVGKMVGVGRKDLGGVTASGQGSSEAPVSADATSSPPSPC